jgi:acyl carrier protein
MGGLLLQGKGSGLTEELPHSENRAQFAPPNDRETWDVIGNPGHPVVVEMLFFASLAMPSLDLISEIKALLVAELNLSGRDPATIPDDAPLFGEGGLGLDSLDALQIAMLVEERFGIRVPEGEDARPIFRSVSSLAQFVEETRSPEPAAGPRPP